jgi:hypothetical protein
VGKQGEEFLIAARVKVSRILHQECAKNWGILFQSHTAPKNGYVSDGEGYHQARVREDKRTSRSGTTAYGGGGGDNKGRDSPIVKHYS